MVRGELRLSIWLVRSRTQAVKFPLGSGCSVWSGGLSSSLSLQLTTVHVPFLIEICNFGVLDVCLAL